MVKEAVASIYRHCPRIPLEGVEKITMKNWWGYDASGSEFKPGTSEYDAVLATQTWWLIIYETYKLFHLYISWPEYDLGQNLFDNELYVAGIHTVGIQVAVFWVKWRWRQRDSPKRWYPIIPLHDVTRLEFSSSWKPQISHTGGTLSIL
jgi:hypothetical protein